MLQLEFNSEKTPKRFSIIQDSDFEMYHQLALIVILVTSIISASSDSYQLVSSVKDADCHNDYTLDYVKLALQWSSGVCATSAEDCERGNHVNNFTIHGFWPCQNSNPMIPNNCCFDSVFNYTELNPIMGLLQRHWYGYFGKNEKAADKKFWEHEWIKHGTCTRDIEYLHGELSYFKTTLNMFLNLPITQALYNANIVPDNDKSYKSADIIDAIKSIHGEKSIEIECAFEHGHKPIPDITGLNFCYTPQLTPTDCPKSKPRCTNKMYFKKSS